MPDSLTPSLRQLVVALVSGPGPETALGAEEFLRRAGVSDGRDLSIEVLADALERRDSVNVEMGTILADVFGVASSRHMRLLMALVDADWHVKHEDVVALLARLRRPESVDALFHATQVVPSYLEYDDSRSLARTATYALASVPGPEAEEALRRLTRSDHRDLRELATKLLSSRSN